MRKALPSRCERSLRYTSTVQAAERLRPSTVLSHDLDRARLESFFAHLLSERDLGADGEMAECVVEHAVSMEIHLVTIAGLQESELAGWVDGFHGRDRFFVLFDLSPQPTNVIL